MRTHFRFCAAALLLASCGDAPRDASTVARAPLQGGGAAQLPPNHPGSGAALPAAHPGLEGSADAGLTDPSVFAGRAVLKGALAEATSGMLMVMLRAKGQRFPIWAYRVDIAAPEAERLGLAPAANGERVLTFALNKDMAMMPQAIPANVELEVAVSYDPDGDVDTKEGIVVGAVAAKAGDTALSIDIVPPAMQ